MECQECSLKELGNKIWDWNSVGKKWTKDETSERQSKREELRFIIGEGEIQKKNTWV